MRPPISDEYNESLLSARLKKIGGGGGGISALSTLIICSAISGGVSVKVEPLRFKPVGSTSVPLVACLEGTNTDIILFSVKVIANRF